MRVLDLVALLLAAASVVTGVAGPELAHWAAKPLAGLGMLLVAAAGVQGSYRTLIMAGLVCALAGDVLLLAGSSWFLAGLACFLGTQLCYIGAFWPGVGFRAASIARLVYVTLGVAMVAALWPVLGPVMRVAIAVYAAFLVTMAGQAAARWAVLRTPLARSAGLGAVFFLLSDGMLALDRWRAQFPGARLAVLATYYLAQWLIARSTAEPSPERTAA